jgi:hypothetical protein
MPFQRLNKRGCYRVLTLPRDLITALSGLALGAVLRHTKSMTRFQGWIEGYLPEMSNHLLPQRRNNRWSRR